MATSLAAQLQRLAAPQTTTPYETKRKPSILFDAKEAAAKDREVIYDIGLSGLEELINMNKRFKEFEWTLFDKKSMDVQRSVADKEVNEKLNEVLLRFLCQLSPYFMLQPAHKCLEWLIRRFEIHQYNRRNFVNMILPYHETRMFVRCIQTLSFKDGNDSLAFLQPAAKSGVPPTKRIIIDHCMRHPEFLTGFGKFLISATTELGRKKTSLQAAFAFFCTTTLGMLDGLETVTEKHVVAVLQPTLKGLVSKAPDFAAASYMIIGQMVTKTSLMSHTLHMISSRLCTVEDPSQRTDAVMLLVLIFQTQAERMAPLSEKLLVRLVNEKWILPALSAVKTDGIDILVCYRMILEQCLNEICQGREIELYGQFCDSLLLEIQLTDLEAVEIIHCVLDSYCHTDEKAEKEKPSKKASKQDDGDVELTINLDSDEENDGNYGQVDEKITSWYSEFLQRFERQYPDAFDRVVKLALKGQNQYSHKKRNALRNVLGFLLQSSYNKTEANVFENLFHYDAEKRMYAVRYIVGNLRKLTLKSHGKVDLLRDSISERLSDDSQQVVLEVLKLSPSELIGTFGKDRLVAKLNELALKCAANQSRWKNVTPRLIELLTDERIYKRVDMMHVIIGLYPLLFPLGKHQHGKALAEQLRETDFGKHYLVPKFYGTTENCDLLLTALEAGGQCKDPIQVCFNILLASSALPSSASSEQAIRLLDYALKQLKGHHFQYAMSSDIQHLKSGKLPYDLITIPIRNIIERVQFDSSVPVSFERPCPLLQLRLTIYSELLERYCKLDAESTELRTLFGDLLKSFLTLLYPDTGELVQFLSHFYTTHLIERDANEGAYYAHIRPDLQIRSLNLTNTLLGQMVGRKSCEITLTALVNVLLSLTSNSAVVRQCGLNTLQHIIKLGQGSKFSKETRIFLATLVKRREELIMDGEQLSLLMFTVFTGEDGKPFKSLLESFLEYTRASKSPGYIATGIADMLKLLDEPIVLHESASRAVDILESASNDCVRPTFNGHETKMLQLVIGRFSADVVRDLMRSDHCQRVITLALQCHKPMLVPSKRRHCSPAITMIEALSEELFESLPKSFAKQVLKGVVEAATLSEHPETNSAVSKLFKNCTIDAELTVELVSGMCSHGTAGGGPLPVVKPLRHAILSVAPCERVLLTMEWKRGVTLLEHMQNKRKLLNAQVLVPKLFDCLKYCLDFEEQSLVEYVKQIVLSLLLHCIVKVEETQTERDTPAFGGAGAVFKVEQIVQCIRGSQNPQTHHHALLLLAHVARYVPEQVLHNMMEIFTFVGSSIVRQDDAYSFQIITKIIETIIPTIAHSGREAGPAATNEQVIPILKIFSDIVMDVPEHRRILLYVKLLQTLGAEEYLWVFLGVLIESDVLKGGHKSQQATSRRGRSRAEAEQSNSELSKRMEVALLIAREFSPTIILQTCTNLIDYLRELPMEPEKRKDGEELMEVDMTDAVIFNVKAHTGRQLRHFKYVLVQFVGGLVSSVFVVNKIAQLNEEETVGMKKYYQNLIVGILTYVNAVSKTIDRLKAEGSDEKIPLYWRAMLNYCYEILESTISLLSADTLIIVVHGLLQHRFLMVRRKVIELLNNKLQYKQDYFAERHHPGLLKLIDPLMELVKHMYDEESVVGTAFERMVIVQQCYIALRHLSKILTQHATKRVQAVLADLIEELVGYKRNPNPQILASLILCIGELCSNLGPHSINFLPKFMPMVIKFLNAQLQLEEPLDMLTHSIVLLTVKIVDTLSRFLSPYLPAMLVALSKLYALVEQREEGRHANMLSRLGLIWSNLSSTITPRVLMPAIEECYHELVEQGELGAIKPLMSLVSAAFGNLKSADFNALRGELAELFLTILQFRCNQSTSDRFTLAQIDAAEEHVIKAFVVLILKLSESTFRPLFYQVFEWSIRESSSNDRAITFFNLCSLVAEALKSLFVLFASDIVTIAAKLLNATNKANGQVDGETGEGEDGRLLHFEDESKNVTLLRYVLKTLYSILLYDNQNFINAVRFNMLLEPIANQLENGLIIHDSGIRSLVIDCLAQMAVAVMDDSLWRQLNFQVLLKTRNNDPDVRIFALEACTEIARKLGESYAPLLPETIPYLAELMEDDNEDVEKAVHHSCRVIGRAVGEDLQKYF